MTRVDPSLLASAVAVASVLAACTGGGSDEAVPMSTPSPDQAGPMSTLSSDEDASTSVSGDRFVARDEPESTTSSEPAPPPVDDVSAARQRCLGVGRLMERRIDEEGFEWPDEGPELDEDELDRVMAPEYAHIDGVASPDERPTIDPIPAYDPETVSILELDRLAMVCVESDIATVEEVHGEHDLGDEDVDGEFDDDDWCEELAAMSSDDIDQFVAEFVADEDADVVSEEFAECGLADPFTS